VRVVDDAILARLGDPVPDELYRYFRSSVGVTIHDGIFDARPAQGDPVVVKYDLPYAVYASSVGDDDEETRRLDGRIPRDSVFFSFIYIGLDRRQAKWAGERIWAQMRRWRPVVTGYRTEIVNRLESQRVRRDDEAIRPDGTPLFYGVDNYAVGIRPNN
jgi:hypothetical protein